LKISSKENKHKNVPSTSKDQTFKQRPSFSMRRKHLTITVEDNKHTKRAIDLEDQHSKLRHPLAMKMKHLKIPEEENKHTNVPSIPKIGLSSQKSRL